jgi:ribosomal protein S18 acetylase RimI-like enzyme
MTVDLRIMSADDWRTWRSLRLAALTDAPGAFGSRLQEWVNAPEDRWRQRLSIPGAIDLLAFDADENAAVGMATGTPDEDDGGRAQLISMWVDPAARGRGVATALITAIAHWAASYGAATLALSVMPDNAAARRTYEGNGFIVSREPGDLLPGGRPEFVMLRDLSSERTVTKGN